MSINHRNQSHPRNRRSLAILSLVAFSLFGSFLFYELIFTTGQSTQACENVYTVTALGDAGAGTLRDGLANVCPFGTVQIDNSLSGGEILLDSQLNITENMTIRSDVPISVSGQGITRSFRVSISVDVTFDGLTIRNGFASGPEFTQYYGAGIYAQSGFTVITITNSIFENNEAEREGGAVYSRGNLTIINSEFRNNSSGRSGGAVYARKGFNITDSLFEENEALVFGGGLFVFDEAIGTLSSSTFYSNTADEGGGFFNDGTITAENVTLSQNRAENGGGIMVGPPIPALGNPGGDTTLNNVTLAGNSATDSGGGIDNDNILRMTNVLIADSVAGGDCDTADGTLVVNTNNLVEDNSCTPALSGDPALEPLADNGGGTPTHALTTGSPAIDAGTATCVPTDQRGIVRPVGPACDIGAFEYQDLPEIAVFGNGLEIANNDQAPDPLDDTEYEPTSVGDTHVHTFTIANQGPADLILSSVPPVQIVGGGGAFTVIADPTTPIGTGNQSTFQIEFEPSAIGLVTATVEIVNNDPNENPYTFVISGNGVVPEMSVSGNGIEIASGSLTPDVANGTNFGTSATPIAQTFTIANTGNGELILGGTPIVVVSGSAEFAVTQQPPFEIPAGGSGTFEVTFTPTGPGGFVAQVSIQSNDPDENPYVFALQGARDVALAADLTLTKSDSVDPVAPGAVLEYTIVVQNSGTADATQVVISDTLPANTTYVANSISGADIQVDSGLPILGWVDNILPAGESVTLSYQVTVDPSTPTGTTILNTATVTTTSALADTNDLSDTIGTTVATATAPAAQFSSATYTAVESDGTTLITVNIDPVPTTPVSVDLTIADGATFSNPIVANGTQTLNFAANAGSQIVPITINNDALFEGDQPVNLTLSNPTGGLVLGGTSTSVLTVSDDESAPTITIADVSQVEGDGPGAIQVPVTISSAADVAISVDYQSLDGSAQAGSDYTAVNGTLTIPAGQVAGTISVPVLGDTAQEGDEQLTILLSNPVNAILANSIGTATLTEDDTGTPPTALTEQAFMPLLFSDFNGTPDLIVESITASTSDVAITIRNIGLSPVSNSFWVDLYINPPVPPTQPNETIETLGVEGIVWGVKIENVSLGANEALVLRLNDGLMDTTFTNFSGTLPAGATVYVQVDSAKVGSEEGNVPETHEIFGTPYNNISSATVN